MEEADTVLSLEQTRTSGHDYQNGEMEIDDSEDELSSSSSSSSGGELFPKMKDDPEDLLQLAPDSGDAIIPLTGGTFLHATYY